MVWYGGKTLRRRRALWEGAPPSGRAASPFALPPCPGKTQGGLSVCSAKVPVGRRATVRYGGETLRRRSCS